MAKTYLQAALESLLSSDGNGINDVNERSPPTQSIHPSQDTSVGNTTTTSSQRSWTTERTETERGGEEKGKSGNSSEDTSSTGAGPMTTAADIQEQASEIELSMLSRDGG